MANHYSNKANVCFDYYLIEIIFKESCLAWIGILRNTQKAPKFVFVSFFQPPECVPKEDQVKRVIQHWTLQQRIQLKRKIFIIWMFNIEFMSMLWYLWGMNEFALFYDLFDLDISKLDDC